MEFFNSQTRLVLRLPENEKATFGLMPNVAFFFEARLKILSSDHRQCRALGYAAVGRPDGSVDLLIGRRRADVEGR